MQPHIQLIGAALTYNTNGGSRCEEKFFLRLNASEDIIRNLKYYSTIIEERVC
jgi:hypothetical protein